MLQSLKWVTSQCPEHNCLLLQYKSILRFGSLLWTQLAACLQKFEVIQVVFFQTVRRKSTEIAQSFLRASPAAVSNILCSRGSVNITTFCKSCRLEDVSEVKHLQWTSSPVSFSFFYEITGCMAYRWLPAEGYIFLKIFFTLQLLLSVHFLFYSTFYLFFLKKKSLY